MLYEVITLEMVRAFGYHVPLLRDLNPPRGENIQGIPIHPADDQNGSIAAFVTEGRTWYSGLRITSYNVCYTKLLRSRWSMGAP